MIINSSSSDFSGDSSDFSGNDSIRSGLIDENICGEGATCVVYQMNLQGLHVAVKRLRDDYLGDPTHRAAFRKEFQIGRQLKHDAIPTYRELTEGNDEVYMVIDFIDGVSLSKFIASEEGQRFFRSKENIRHFLLELVGVVGYLHRKGVIHCDIKPDNIMLRHSDQGLMLIDLDKAYSDTLDRTSGGTSGFSDLLESGEKPTAAKDFLAIGKVFDFIAANSSRFPVGRFKRFRAECNNPATSTEKLSAALKPRSHTGLWTVGIMLISCIIIGIGLLVYKNTLKPAYNEPAEMKSAQASTDTVTEKTVDIVEPQQIVSSKPTMQETKQVVVRDFDKRMTVFIQEAQKDLEDLSSGALANRQIRDMMLKMVESYTSTYQSILADYKAGYSEVHGIDVELAVARVAEKSRASSLLQKFTQAACDTINARHPEPYSEK